MSENENADEVLTPAQLATLKLLSQKVLTAEKLMEEHDELLTPAEMEIFKLLDKGLCEKLVADILTKPEGTVHVHIKHVYRKLNVHNVTSALHKLREKGIFQTTDIIYSF